MAHTPHPAIVAHEKITTAFSRLNHLCTEYYAGLDKPIAQAFEIGRILKSAREHDYQGVVRQAVRLSASFYYEMALNKDHLWDEEEWLGLLDSLAVSLPITDLAALRVFTTGSRRAMENAVEGYTSNSDPYDQITLKQDAVGILKTLASSHVAHAQSTAKLIRFFADVSNSWPQSMPPANVVYAIAGYYGALPGPIDIDQNHNIGLILKEFMPYVERSGFQFEIPKIEECLALYKHGYPKEAGIILGKCFPNTYALKITGLLEIERQTDIDLKPLVASINRPNLISEANKDSHHWHTGMLFLHYLCSQKPEISFEELNLCTLKVMKLIPEWSDLALGEFRDTLNEDNLRTAISFATENNPKLIAELQKLPRVREFLKTIELHRADLLAEDMGL